METVRVRVGDNGYPVLIGKDLLETAGARMRKILERERVIVVADRRVAGLHGTALRRSLRAAKLKTAAWIDIPPGESAKTLTRARRLYQAFMEAGVDRWTPVVALGGGVIGDLAGFVASTFYRGMPVVHLPTTVVAQVDSSVGGKTAVNFSGAKNLVGTFHQPALVVADTSLLGTLNPREYRAGLAEAVKIAVTLRPDLMQRLETDTEAVVHRDPGVLQTVVKACVEAKAEVVSRDERERDVRAILNYGHTLGHAVEATLLGRMRHGEAVAVGMNGAAWLGEELGVTVPEVRLRQNTLLDRLGLKLTAPGVDNRVIARKLKLDKKVRDRKTRFVLTLQIGGASVWPHVPAALVRGAIREVAPGVQR